MDPEFRAIPLFFVNFKLKYLRLIWMVTIFFIKKKTCRIFRYLVSGRISNSASDYSGQMDSAILPFWEKKTCLIFRYLVSGRILNQASGFSGQMDSAIWPVWDKKNLPDIQIFGIRPDIKFSIWLLWLNGFGNLVFLRKKKLLDIQIFVIQPDIIFSIWLLRQNGFGNLDLKKKKKCRLFCIRPEIKFNVYLLRQNGFSYLTFWGKTAGYSEIWHPTGYHIQHLASTVKLIRLSGLFFNAGYLDIW